MNGAIVVTLLLPAGQAPAASRDSVTAIEPSDQNTIKVILQAGSADAVDFDSVHMYKHCR